VQYPSSYPPASRYTESFIPPRIPVPQPINPSQPTVIQPLSS
jgi:hypothetical protein